MKVLNEGILHKAAKKNAPLRKSLAEWIDIARAAQWKNLMEVRQTFPSADGVRIKVSGFGDIIVTVFNIKGNEYRLLTLVNYENAIVVIKDVLTHAEYDKGAWKGQI
jgi:mRNA interferase HigB